MEESLFAEISVILAIGAGVALVMRLLKQPLIISYILTGVIAGPVAFNLIHSVELFEVFSNIGIALLLFIIGLGLNPQIIREVGKVSIFTGTGQVIATILAGVGLSYIIGSINDSEALFVGLAMTFSSTIIVLKLLSDKKEQNRLHGKISIGVLLVQDLVATIALLVLSASGEGGLSVTDLLLLIVKGGWFAIVLYLVSTYVLPRLHSVIAGTSEFLFLFAIAWGFGVATLFETIGFSVEVGALFAGVSLASLPYAQEMSSRLRPLRDFFIVVFFITLGAGLNLDNLSEVIVPALIISLAVIIVKPIAIMTILGLMGYTKRTSFQVGIVMAQISEFSLIFLVLANRHEYVGAELLTTMTLVGLITIAVSTYMIIYTNQLYRIFEKHLHLFERRGNVGTKENVVAHDIVMFGFQRGGKEFVKTFKSMKKSYVVVDYNPDIIDELDATNHNYIYGDANDVELLDEIGLEKAKLIISTMTDRETNEFLVKHIQDLNPKAVIIAHAESEEEAKQLYEIGATYVIIPHYWGTEKIGSFLKKNGFKKTEFKKFREKHLHYIEKTASL